MQYIDSIAQGHKLLEILSNKDLMREIDKKPSTKRKLLEKLLSEHRHIMTSAQVSRLTQILNALPPLDTVSKILPIYANINDNNNNNNNTSYVYPASNNIFNQGTTPRDMDSRQLQTTQQYNTIDALTKHYRTEAEEEEVRFKIEEERRRKDFAEKQRQRRLHYQSSLTDLEKSNVDALRLFQLQKSYTIDELKAAYKKMAMKTHPDKTGGNAEQFQLVTKCYMSLLEKHKNRETEKPFNDLRQGSKTYIESQTRSYDNTLSTSSKQRGSKSKSKTDILIGDNNLGTVSKDKFDAKLFNKIYEQNKLWESGDDGYGDWLTSNEQEEAPEEVFGKKFNINVFNTTFEGYKDKLTSQSGAIQEYQEPQSLISSSTGFTDIDIFARKVNDFSKPLPIGSGKGGSDLAYTDLKTAYSSRGAFIDPSKVDYKEYKSIDELKKDRSNVKYEMTPEQLRNYEMKKIKENTEEEQRQEIIRQRDSIVSNTYGKLHEKMLGYRGNANY